jgi:hypothetical protein
MKLGHCENPTQDRSSLSLDGFRAVEIMVALLLLICAMLQVQCR